MLDDESDRVGPVLRSPPDVLVGELGQTVVHLAPRVLHPSIRPFDEGRGDLAIHPLRHRRSWHPFVTFLSACAFLVCGIILRNRYLLDEDCPELLDHPDRRSVLGIDGQDDPVVVLSNEWSQGPTRMVRIRASPMLGKDFITDVPGRHCHMPRGADPKVDMANRCSVIKHDLEAMGRGEPSRGISGQSPGALQMDWSGAEAKVDVPLRRLAQSSLLRSQALAGSLEGDGDLDPDGHVRSLISGRNEFECVSHSQRSLVQLLVS